MKGGGAQAAGNSSTTRAEYPRLGSAWRQLARARPAHTVNNFLMGRDRPYMKPETERTPPSLNPPTERPGTHLSHGSEEHPG